MGEGVSDQRKIELGGILSNLVSRKVTQVRMNNEFSFDDFTKIVIPDVSQLIVFLVNFFWAIFSQKIDWKISCSVNFFICTEILGEML